MDVLEFQNDIVPKILEDFSFVELNEADETISVEELQFHVLDQFGIEIEIFDLIKAMRRSEIPPIVIDKDVKLWGVSTV